MRLIDAERLKNIFALLGFKFALMIIDSTPTIDAVEVVRCKDCKQYKHYSSVFGEARTCHLLCAKTKENDYCSYGERKA